jgi:hypothetical protein
MTSTAFQRVPSPSVGVATSAPANPGLETLRAKVTELIPSYHLVYLETAEGRGLALTAKTAGIDLASLRVGQMVECQVTRIQPRVVQASALA